MTTASVQQNTGWVGEWRPIWRSPLYHLSLFAVAAVIVLLPLAYLALIVGVGWGAYWHATENLSLITEIGSEARGGYRARGWGLLLRLLFYAGPLVVAAGLLVFLLKPFVASESSRYEHPSIYPSEEPALFAHVEEVCRVLGAPTPKRIDLTGDVNAAASFRRGLWSVFVPGDLVLTIGMPLVTGLSLRQFTGVLAHEFAHFNQGAAMRAYLITHTIVAWFQARAARRDTWDDALDEWAEEAPHPVVWITVLVLRLCVFATRMVLWVFALVAAALTSFMSRQMEYDADRHQARLIGSADAIATMRRIHELSAATQTAISQAHEQWRATKKLANDVPSIIAAASRSLPASERDRIERMLTEEGAGLFDSHPAPKRRVRAMERQNESGVYGPPGPAAALFRDLKGANVRATYAMYKEFIGEEVFEGTFVDSSVLVEQHSAAERMTGELERYLGFTPPASRSIFLGQSVLAPAEDPGRAWARVREARAALASMRDLAKHAEAYDQAYRQFSRCAQAKTLLDLGLTKLSKSLKIERATPAAVAKALEDARDQLAATSYTLDGALEAGAKRLGAALNLLARPDVHGKLPDGAALAARAMDLVVALDALKRVQPAVRMIGEQLDEFEAIIMAVGQGAGEDDRVRKRVKQLDRALRPPLEEVRRDAGGTRYPFESSKPGQNIGRFLTGAGRFQTDPEWLLTASRDVVIRAGQMHARILGELAGAATVVEHALDAAAAKRGGRKAAENRV